MIKISRLADYSVVVLSVLASARGQQMSAAILTQKTSLPEPTVSKVLKLLVKDNIIVSVRGANGGYSLQQNAHAITIADIIMAIDGPISLATCVVGSTDSCDYECKCPIKGRWDGVDAAIRGALDGITLADMMAEERNMFSSVAPKRKAMQ